ncbi:MAG: DMT family transporter [Rectinemataceae bacterium]|nr:DMT family transporter [Rectinemataceae bacterium]
MSESRALTAGGIAFALISALGFSTLGIFATSLYAEGFSVPQTLAWRFTIASAFLWIVLGAKKALQPGIQIGGKGKNAFRNLMLLAIFGFTPQAGLFFVAVKLLAPGITSLLLYLYPAFVLLLSALFFRRHPTKGQLIALTMSFLGCIVTFFSPGDYPVAGLLLGVFVAITYAAYLVFGERILISFTPIFSTAVIMSVAAVFYWFLVLVSGLPPRLPAGLSEWFSIVGIGLVATVWPITALMVAIKKAGAANVSLLSTVEPVSTVLLSALLLGEKLTMNRLWGGLFIIGGVVALRLFSTKKN